MSAYVNGHRWTRDDEYAWQAERAHEEHTASKSWDAVACLPCEAEWRMSHPDNYGDCLCDVNDAPAHESYL